MLKYAIGDVHGMYALLLDLLSKIEDDAAGEPYQLIFLGDYVDRGRQSKEVIALVRQLVSEGKALAIMGNHEEMMFLGCHNFGARRMWLNNGGVETLFSFDPSMNIRNMSTHTGRIPIDVLEWAQSLPYWIEDEHRIYVHAGITKGYPMEKQSKDVLTWIRDETSVWPGGDKLVVHGHTPIATFDEKSMVLAEAAGRLNLDGGSCFYGMLGSAKFNDDQQMPLKFIVVKGDKPDRIGL